MFAYCLNNPAIHTDEEGTLTVTVGVSAGITVFFGISGGLAVTFDKDGFSIQYSYSEPSDTSASTLGLFCGGISVFGQVTNKESASELEGSSTYLGGSLGETGFDLVCDKPVADQNGQIVGAQITYGIISGGVDVHVSQTITITKKTLSWSEVWEELKELFTS